jgi:hypothetical protein
MVFVLLACALLLTATTLLHYEALRGLNLGLPRLGIPDRPKLVLVIIVAFFAHAAEMVMYGGAYYGLIGWLDTGSLSGAGTSLLATCMYLSAETYTSLGFGDVTPVGPVRMLVGVEALNGLLLIGWSASFTYISMERFWSTSKNADQRTSNS